MHTVEIVQRAIDYVEEHLTEPLSLEQIGEAAVMSVPNLYRLFYATTGHPIKEYIRRRRTSEAACLLRQTRLPSNEIGFRCGFDTYQTFLKTFKRNTGMTPGLYRKAQLIYSFERISLYERESYLEEREIFERYPDVKVIRLSSRKGIGYLYVTNREEGLEDEALLQFRALLAKNQIDPASVRLFGWNVDLEGERASFYGYQLAAVSEKNEELYTEHPDLQSIVLSGGTYAISWVPAGTGRSIVTAWNRLLSEWLPRSTFELGNHGFIEEYQQFNGSIARLKLYLPVRRSQEGGTIEVLELNAMKVISFRAGGLNCVSEADEAAMHWITRNGFQGDSRLQVYMSRNYGSSSEDSNTYELSISIPEGFAPPEEDAHRVAWLEGGLYACLTTRAYGEMTGVLERIYRWLSTSLEYEADGTRSWYAHYVPDDNVKEWVDGAFERAVSVECCVPVLLRNLEQED